VWIGVGEANAAVEGDVVAESAPPAMARTRAPGAAAPRRDGDGPLHAREDAAAVCAAWRLPRVEELRSVLSLPTSASHRGFDIAHIGGRLPSRASLFRDGNPDRKNYRLYGSADGRIIDDFASMREVASRATRVCQRRR
jgi:hypothetical protein